MDRIENTKPCSMATSTFWQQGICSNPNYSYRHAELHPTDVFEDKWQSFVCQPMYNKSVISIPGIGQRYSERLREHGFVHATQIYMQYLQMDGNHAHFVDWLARLCMPYHHPLNTMYHMENAYAALSEWHRQFRN